MTVQLILGGPGAGKSTKLLAIVEEHLARGVSPSRIGYFAFTRRAAYEARDRAVEKFGLTKEDLPYFRTIHSFAFKQLGLSTEEMIRAQDYKILGEALGEDLSVKFEEDMGVPTGCRIVFLDHLSRATGTPLQHLCALAQIPYWRVEHYSRTLRDYKRERFLIDYSDMLERYVAGEGAVPDLDVIVVDEAQDLTALQWRVIDRITKGAPYLYIGGDDWQAIYQWSGADVKRFLATEGERVVLPVSHRCSAAVHQFAHEIGLRIKAKIPKGWTSDRPGGSVTRTKDPDMIRPDEGSWFMLARHRHMLRRYTEMLRLRGYPYTLGDHSSVGTDGIRAVLWWEQLRRGEAVGGGEVKNVYKHMHQRCLSKTQRKFKGDESGVYTLGELQRSFGLLTDMDWMSSIDLPLNEREYVRAIKARGESLLKHPRIHISTIHGVKGGEADHVAIMTDITARTYASFCDDPDGEARCFFVAASRARESIHLLMPATSRSYLV